MASVSGKTLIIGAGPAGLGAGIALGSAALVLERGPSAGGLCQTIELAGAIFDLGGHSFHTPHQKFRDLVFHAIPLAGRATGATSRRS
jgi:protoporphyrinogen oxidase